MFIPTVNARELKVCPSKRFFFYFSLSAGSFVDKAHVIPLLQSLDVSIIWNQEMTVLHRSRALALMWNISYEIHKNSLVNLPLFCALLNTA